MTCGDVGIGLHRNATCELALQHVVGDVVAHLDLRRNLRWWGLHRSVYLFGFVWVLSGRGR